MNTKTIKIRNLFTVICNILLFVLSFIAVARCAAGNGGGFMETESGVDIFRYYGILSCTLVSLLSIPATVLSVKGFRSGQDLISRSALLMMLVGTTAVTVTFVICFFYLGPREGYIYMFEGANFSLHFLCPALAVISFVFFLGGGELSEKDTRWGALPTLIYGTIYLVMVIFAPFSGYYWMDFCRLSFHFNWFFTYPFILWGGWWLSAFLGTIHNARRERLYEQ